MSIEALKKQSTSHHSLMSTTNKQPPKPDPLMMNGSGNQNWISLETVMP